MTAYAVINGQSIPPAIGTGITVMDKTNVDDPDDREVRLLGVIGLTCHSRAAGRACGHTAPRPAVGGPSAGS